MYIRYTAIFSLIIFEGTVEQGQHKFEETGEANQHTMGKLTFYILAFQVLLGTTILTFQVLLGTTVQINKFFANH